MIQYYVLQKYYLLLRNCSLYDKNEIILLNFVGNHMSLGLHLRKLNAKNRL